MSYIMLKHSLLASLMIILLSLAPSVLAGATTLSFDGAQYMRLWLGGSGTFVDGPSETSPSGAPLEQTTEAEDISLRFRTTRGQGLLLATTSTTTPDRIVLALQDAKLKLDITLNSGTKTLYTGASLDDNHWHTVTIKRRAHRVELRVDKQTVTKERLNRNERSIQFDTIHVGKKTKRDAGDLEKQDNFVGYMQQLIFNGHHLFEMARTGEIKNVETTAVFDKTEKLVNFPVTFKTAPAYLRTKLNIYGTFSLHFQLKTTQPDGLIMYSGGRLGSRGGGNDFMAIEMYEGNIRYIYDVGSGPRVLVANVGIKLNDNAWHDVAILRPILSQHILRVDEASTYDNLPDNKAVHFDTTDDFHIGGVARNHYAALPKSMKATEGFQGCLASIDLHGDSRNLLKQRIEIEDEYRNLITEGCQGPSLECTAHSCENGGECVQEWNSFTCNCDMTSFTGSTCTEDSTAYTFGSDGGLLTFTFPENQRPDQKKDKIALGFITTQKDAVIARITSGGSQDYLEIELVDGHLFVVYNMGTMDHPIGDFSEQVSDGQYHIVRFVRSGPNSTLQVDDMPLQSKNPTGNQLNVFNNQAHIHVGGRRDESGKLVRPYQGTLAGLVVNGLKILELSEQGDPRVVIAGDVQLEIPPLDVNKGVTASPDSRPVIATPISGDDKMHATVGGKTENGDGTDDLVISGMGSGCQYEDADDCAHQASGTTDSLIKPVAKIITTPQPPTTNQPITSPKDELTDASGEGPGPCEDDEDCDENGSGNGGAEERDQGPKGTDDIGFKPEQGTGEDAHAGEETGAVGETPKPDGDTEPHPPTPDTLIVKVNMTETPIKKPAFGSTTQKPANEHENLDPTYAVGEEGSGTGVAGGGGPSSGTGGDTGTGTGTGTEPKESKSPTSSLGLNIGLIVGIAAGVVLLLLILAYALYKYKSRDESGYKVDEGKNYRYDSCNTKPPPPPPAAVTNGSTLSKSHGGTPTKPKKKDVKEWYV